MDDSYYRNYLKSVYEDPEIEPPQGTGKVYYIDPLLFNLRNQTGVVEILSLGDLFKDISGVSYRVESPAAAAKRASATEAEIEGFPFASQNPVPPYDGNTPFEGMVDRELVAIDLTRSSNKLDPTGLMGMILQAVNPNKSSDLDKSHNSMHAFMRDLHQFSGQRFMLRIQDLVRADSDSDTASTNKWKQAKYAFGRLSLSELSTLIERLSDAADSSMKTIVETHAALQMNKRDITTSITYLDDFKMNFKGPLYYRLKIQMIKNIQLPRRFTVETTEDNQFTEYFKMLAVDVYIKACYQVIVYYYISNMAQTYARLGDFVNARIALLAKVMYTYFFVNAATKNYMDQPGLSADKSQAVASQVATVYTTLNNYLHRMNSSEIDISEVIKEAHTKSNDVVDKNRNIQKLQENIRKNQLALRNVLYNADELKKKYARMKIELIVLAVILLTMIVSCSVLLAIKMNTPVLYVAGGVAIAILAYAIIKMVLSIIKNNK